MQPTEGEVFFCGRALAEIATDQLFSSIGFVQQEGFLFQDSIAKNLKYAKGNASEKEMRQALRHVGLQEFFEELPDGLNTMIGARGIRLSGGERQRLILARMMLKKPRILILDEATSAVEETREKELYEAILHEINPENSHYNISSPAYTAICQSFHFIRRTGYKTMNAFHSQKILI